MISLLEADRAIGSVTDPAYPSRRQLIIGGALVALLQYSDGGPDDRKAASAIADAVRSGRAIETSNIGILDRLAWARQTMDVSREEWADAVRVTRAEATP